MGKEIDKEEKYRAFRVILTDGSTIYLESDTANSLMGDLDKYLNIIIPQIENVPVLGWPNATYIQRYKLHLNSTIRDYYKPFRNYYFYTLLSKLPDVLHDEITIECYTQLEERARLMHTLKNMILVPYGYNRPRGWGLTTYKSNRRINDRLDLTFVDFENIIIF